MIDLSNKRIVLMGGAGFIGHHLALELKSLGADVIVVDSLHVNNLLMFLGKNGTPGQQFYLRFLNERLSLLRQAGISLIVQDVRDYHVISKILAEAKPDVVVHLAAVAHANVSNKDPYSTFDHSLRTLENVLDCVRAMPVHLIYFSSSMIYGNFPEGGVSEDTPCEPLGIYGSLKLAGEKMVTAYNQAFNLKYTIIRPSALYGERCVSRRVGQIFLENAIKGVKISVSGDGSDRLDFTYVKDLVQGVVKSIYHPASHNQIFNITYGESRTIADMAEIVSERFPDIAIEYQPRDKLTPSRGTLSVDKARRLIGYEPAYPLEIGFVNYINWYKRLVSSTLVLDNDSAARTVPNRDSEESLALRSALESALAEKAALEEVLQAAERRFGTKLRTETGGKEETSEHGVAKLQPLR